MKNLDELLQEKLDLAQALGDALAGDDEEATVKALSAYGDYVQEAILEEARKEAKGISDTIDATILGARGVNQLTTEETTYYGKLAEAMKSSNPKQAIDNLDVAMPTTTLERVFDDLTVAHPLLDAIQFQNTTAITEWILNAHESQLAQWGDLTDEIVKEITSGLKKFDMSMYKLSAFIPVANAMLDLGPRWLDRYVREILVEALALATEEAIINGTGKQMPIGMNRSVADDVVVTAGEYPLRTVTKLYSFEPVEYGAFIADNLAVTAKGNPRAVGNALLVCNSQDYLRKVMPATTVRTPTGTYVNDVFPFPTRAVQSTRIPNGKAVIGLADRYFMGIGAGTGGGRLEYSDEYKFLEDQRVYRIKLYGNGRPMDDVSFAWTDISELEPLVQQVRVVNIGDLDLPEA